MTPKTKEQGTGEVKAVRAWTTVGNDNNISLHRLYDNKPNFTVNEERHIEVEIRPVSQLSEPTDDELFEFMSNGEMRNIKWNIDNGYYECRERCKIIGEGLTAREAVLAAYNEEKGKKG